jgi:hypothetical protein
MPVSAGIAAGGSLLSGILGGKGAKSAANTQANADMQAATAAQNASSTGQAGLATAVAQGQTGLGEATEAGLGANAGGAVNALSYLSNANSQIQPMYSPYTQAGSTALSQEQQLTGPGGPLTNQFSFNPSNLQNDPGYQFTLQQGQQALQRSAAAQGNLFSGGTLKSLAGYTTGTANQYFNDAYNRALSTFNTNQQQSLNRVGALSNIANLGYGATNAAAGSIGAIGSQAANLSQNAGQFGANFGLSGAQSSANLGLQGASNLVGQALTNRGNVQAAGTIGATNAYTQGLTGATNAFSSTLALSQLANYLYPQGNYGGAGPGGPTPTSGTPYPSYISPTLINSSPGWQSAPSAGIDDSGDW